MQNSFEKRAATETRLMTAREAAKYLNISERTLWALSNGGDRQGLQVQYLLQDYRYQKE